MIQRTIGLLVLTCALMNCDSDSPDSNGTTGGQEPTESRSFELGFTPWPYDATIEAVNFVYAQSVVRGDFVAHHLDGGIPWAEAFAGTAYPAAVEAEIASRLANTPATHRTYLALSPIDGFRTGLALNWGSVTNEPLSAPWNNYAFDHPDVAIAYTRFASHLITRFEPQYFNLGIEASELILNDFAVYTQYVSFIRTVSAQLRTLHPNVSLMISVALKSPGSVSAQTIAKEIPELISLVDSVGVSAYPYGTFDHANKGDPELLPTNWLSQISDIANGKPIAVAETGWPAEPLQIPQFGLDVQSDEVKQAAYLSKLLAESDSLGMKFIVWFALVDFDALWSGVLQEDPIARVWRDIGLYDSNLEAREGLQVWQSYQQFNIR